MKKYDKTCIFFSSDAHFPFHKSIKLINPGDGYDGRLMNVISRAAGKSFAGILLRCPGCLINGQLLAITKSQGEVTMVTW